MTKWIAATQGPVQSKAFGEAVTGAAWESEPNFYVVAAKDRMSQPALERALAKRLNATTVVLPISHVPMLSRPKEVADLIIKAAEVR